MDSLRIAVEKMASAIKTISVQRGHDVTEYALNAFGGAAAQHACQVADALGIRTILIHPNAGVLSAYGMGLADIRALTEPANACASGSGRRGSRAPARWAERRARALAEVEGQGAQAGQTRVETTAFLRYEGSDTTLEVPFADAATMAAGFHRAHRQRYGFSAPERRVLIESCLPRPSARRSHRTNRRAMREYPPAARASIHRAFTGGAGKETPLYRRADLMPGKELPGPAIIVEDTATAWGCSRMVCHGGRERPPCPCSQPGARQGGRGPSRADPVMLEVFNNLFISVARADGRHDSEHRVFPST